VASSGIFANEAVRQHVTEPATDDADSARNTAGSAVPIPRNSVAAMVRVTFNDLSRLPVERLARLLMERAAEDPMLLDRLHATVTEGRAAATAPDQPPPGRGSTQIVGNSPAMRNVAAMIARFVRTDEPVLITGESGTGKELAARAIHETSRRRTGPFVAVNCAAIPANLVASELFGYERGAFTGANTRTKGQIEHANGGTLFLDEIGDMPVDLQGHLLRFLQNGQIVRVGGRETFGVDVRIVAATNVRLRQAIADGRFREDLYYRLNVLTLQLPPLRDRPEDIEPLARHFLREAARDFGREVADFEPAALDRLRRYGWPGNIRELMSAVRRAVVIGNSNRVSTADLIGLEDTNDGAAAPRGRIALRPGSDEERTALLDVLSRTQENISLAAQELGVSRVTLYRMLRRHAVDLDRGWRDPPAPARGNRPAGSRMGSAGRLTTGWAADPSDR
jgi:transcriptional regulator with PAS, ATPase and Fis domain